MTKHTARVKPSHYIAQQLYEQKCKSYCSSCSSHTSYIGKSKVFRYYMKIFTFKKKVHENYSWICIWYLLCLNTCLSMKTYHTWFFQTLVVNFEGCFVFLFQSWTDSSNYTQRLLSVAFWKIITGLKTHMTYYDFNQNSFLTNLWNLLRGHTRVSQSNGINVQTGKLMLATSFSG